MASSSASHRACLPIAGKPPIQEGERWSLLEAQGTLAPPEDSSGEAGAGRNGDHEDDEGGLLLGDLEVAPAIGKRVPCYLKIGTLSVEGDHTKLGKPWAVLQQHPPPRRAQQGGASRSASVANDDASVRQAVRHETIVAFGDAGAVEDALRKRARSYGVGRPVDDEDDASSDDEIDALSSVHYGCRVLLTERFFVKMKPVRSIPPRS